MRCVGSVAPPPPYPTPIHIRTPATILSPSHILYIYIYVCICHIIVYESRRRVYTFNMWFESNAIHVHLRTTSPEIASENTELHNQNRARVCVCICNILSLSRSLSISVSDVLCTISHPQKTNNRTTLQDYVTIYDGYTTRDPVILKFCGGGQGVPAAVSSGPELLVEFATSPYGTFLTSPSSVHNLNGFQLEVSEASALSVNTPRTGSHACRLLFP